MKVILLKDVVKVGKKNEIKDFSDGYAQNVLIAKGLAMRATPHEIAKLQSKKVNLENIKQQEAIEFKNLIKLLNEQPIVVKVNSNKKGHMFQALSKSDVLVSANKNLGVALEEDWIIFSKPIKERGEHIVQIKKGDLEDKIKILIQ